MKVVAQKVLSDGRTVLLVKVGDGHRLLRSGEWPQTITQQIHYVRGT